MVNLTLEYVRDELWAISAKRQDETYFLLSPEGRMRLSALIALIKDVDTIELFILWLKCENMKCPPLELLWSLNETKCLKVTTYLHCHFEHNKDIIEMNRMILFSPECLKELSQCKKIFVGLMSSFLNLWNPLDKTSTCGQLIDHFTDKVLHEVYDDIELNFSYLNDLVVNGNVSVTQFTNLAVHHFKEFLYYKPELAPTSMACETHTRKWTSRFLPANNFSLFNQIISMLPEKSFLEEIKVAIGKTNFNWKFILVLVSAYATFSNKTGDLLKEKLDQWFKEALAEKDRDLMIFVLFAFRHCCAEGVRVFSNYPSWFVSVQLKTTAAFSFFFQILTELVPFEPAIHLKIHVNKVPSVPPSCQPVLVDYLTLAKTRLADMNETTNYIGLFNDYHDSDIEGQESDIARVVLQFQETKELPKVLLEAFVFRRTYYEKVFLPRLLSVSEKLDPRRAEVIKKLNSMGKIPNSLYNNWCKLE